MYHRLLKIHIASQDSSLESFLQKITPLQQFSHQFIYSQQVDETKLADCAVIILDTPTIDSDTIIKVHALKAEHAVLIASFSPDNLAIIADVYDLVDQIWIKPFKTEKIQSSFNRILKQIKDREDAALTGKYLDALIDSLPDLIWFKDARGSHLKVNDSFCRTVNKTKAQVEGRGHYYIWDIEPDEYAMGEYVCLESEEIVLNKKETCLFDETVKCGDEMRKFKTYKSPIFDNDGEVIGTAGFAHDVTDLQNLMVELHILIESLPFAVMVTDQDRNITSINQKFSGLFLLEKEDLINKNIECFIDETMAYTKSKRWIIEQEQESLMLLSKDKVLKVQDEPLLDIFGVLAGHIYLFIDITLEHQQKNKLLFDAHTDYLTKLNNRRRLQDFMRKTPCEPQTALLLVDLDNFKDVNDQYGHDEGDRVLVAFSCLLQDIFSLDNLFRLGGDEFAIILPKIERIEIARSYAEKLRDEFEAKVAHQFPHTSISVSIGIAMDVDDDGNFGELFKKADMALYDSKNSGKSAISSWSRPAQ